MLYPFQSGKLVTTMFARITEIVENPNVLVCVLIDEVESLAHARNQCLSGESSFRVLNKINSYSDYFIG